jgi:hypothetical protein
VGAEVWVWEQFLGADSFGKFLGVVGWDDDT